MTYLWCILGLIKKTFFWDCLRILTAFHHDLKSLHQCSRHGLIVNEVYNLNFHSLEQTNEFCTLQNAANVRTLFHSYEYVFENSHLCLRSLNDLRSGPYFNEIELFFSLSPYLLFFAREANFISITLLKNQH